MVSGSVDWQLPAGLPPRGFSDPWAAGWPGEGSCSRIGLSRSRLPLNDRNTAASVSAPAAFIRYRPARSRGKTVTFGEQQSHGPPRAAAGGQQQRRVSLAVDAI